MSQMGYRTLTVLECDVCGFMEKIDGGVGTKTFSKEGSGWQWVIKPMGWDKISGMQIEEGHEKLVCPQHTVKYSVEVI